MRDIERVLTILFRLTSDDVVFAPGLLGVRLSESSDPNTILDDSGLLELEDTPEGFWIFDVVEDDYFLDRVEEAYRSHRKIRCGRR